MTIDTIDVAIAANVSGLQAGLLAAKQMIQSFASSITTTMQNVSAELNNAKMLNMNVDAFRGLEMAAQRADVSVSTLKTSIKQMERSIGEAINKPGGKLAEVFKGLGIDPKALAVKENMQQILEIATRLDQISNTSQRAALEQKLFGRGFNPNLLHQLAIGFQEAEEKVRRLRGEMSNIDAQKILDAKNALADLNSVWTGFKEKLTVAIAPLITQLSENFINAGFDAQTMSKAVVEAMGYVKTAIEGVATAARYGAAAFGIMGMAGNRLAYYAQTEEWKRPYNINKAKEDADKAEENFRWFAEHRNGLDTDMKFGEGAEALRLFNIMNDKRAIFQNMPQQMDLNDPRRKLDADYELMKKFTLKQVDAIPGDNKTINDFMKLAYANAGPRAKKNLSNYVRENSGIDDSLISDDDSKHKKLGFGLDITGRMGEAAASFMSGQSAVSEQKVEDKKVLGVLEKILEAIKSPEGDFNTANMVA